ncbi:MAG: hypothetical protein WBK28_01465 [Minisyncoccia bacterium]
MTIETNGESVPTRNAREAHPGVRIVIEVGGKGGRGEGDESLLNHFKTPEGSMFYYHLDRHADRVDIPAREGAPPSLGRTADLLTASFLEDTYFEGSADSFIAFNTLSVSGVELAPHTPEAMGTSKSPEEIRNALYERILKKIGKILTPAGKAYIGEWITPQILDELRAIDFPKLGLCAEFITYQQGREEQGRARLLDALKELAIDARKTEDISTSFEKNVVEGSTPFLLVLSRV